jgi:hypothetical protein
VVLTRTGAKRLTASLPGIWQTVLMGVGIIVGAGWWILAAELTPAADRPYFGGSDRPRVGQRRRRPDG